MVHQSCRIVTARLLLRDFVPGDARAFVAYHADPRMHAFCGPEQAIPGHARELLARFQAWAEQVPRSNYQLAIAPREAPRRLIGCCGLRMAKCEPGRAELGVELAPAHWGRYRYAVEIMEALAEFGFGELGLQEIFGETVGANARIARLMEFLGAEPVVRPAPAWMAERGWQAVEWRMDREHWERIGELVPQRAVVVRSREV